MQRLVPLFLAIIALAALGCSAQAQTSGRDVCPVIRQGDRWVYEMTGASPGGILSLATGLRRSMEIVAVGKRSLEGREVDVLRETASSVYEFVARDATGCFTVAMQKPGDVDPVPERPLRYAVKYPLQVGTTWTLPYRTQVLLSNDSLQLTRRIVNLNETVTVPAGTFSAVRVTATGSRIIDMGFAIGKVEIRAEHHVWHAPGVGMVKAILKEAGHRPGDPKTLVSLFGEGSLTLELFSSPSAAPK